MEKINPHRKMIVLTGGPCGGKTTIIRELCGDEFWKKRIAVLPEAVFYALQTNISVRKKRFQRLMVEIQSSMEKALDKCLDDELIICHRGTLDPLAYWQRNNWKTNEFFALTGTSIEEHYQRYFAVLHLQTTAINATEFYTRYPDAHRGETTEQAVIIDELLKNIWEKHPNYYLIENKEGGWDKKRSKILDILNSFNI